MRQQMKINGRDRENFKNEIPHDKPRGIWDRNLQEQRGKPRFLHLLFIEKAGQAAGYS
jgi:hypothetical protein